MVVFVKVILLFSSAHLSWTLEGGNLCYRNVSKSGKIVSQKECCTGSMEKNNMCIECLPGFHGLNCNSTCPSGYYGAKCRASCQCDDDTEYCHHVCGCVVQTPVPDNSTTDLNSSDPVPTQSLCLISLDATYGLDTTATNGLDNPEMGKYQSSPVNFLFVVMFVYCPFFISYYL
ncbi:platelet endothelial aggregation receptor 1-like [Ostrea edulis]|uniref:platelet endothelial aggregation receptor 1-like n=1 Tax=Ostrea edulis TaxID=37623 RepID=UPI0024AEDD02|nr:platelet endothelial aggregation receptor 1-like [Ostrea edulis]